MLQCPPDVELHDIHKTPEGVREYEEIQLPQFIFQALGDSYLWSLPARSEGPIPGNTSPLLRRGGSARNVRRVLF